MKENEKLIFNWREEHDFWIKQREYHRINKKGGRKTNRENEIINKKKKQQNGKQKRGKKRHVPCLSFCFPMRNIRTMFFFERERTNNN